MIHWGWVTNTVNSLTLIVCENSCSWLWTPSVLPGHWSWGPFPPLAWSCVSAEPTEEQLAETPDISTVTIKVWKQTRPQRHWQDFSHEFCIIRSITLNILPLVGHYSLYQRGDLKKKKKVLKCPTLKIGLVLKCWGKDILPGEADLVLLLLIFHLTVWESRILKACVCLGFGMLWD